MHYTAVTLAFAVTLFSTWLLTRGPLAHLALDKPNERSMHQTPVPRTGGLGVFAGVLSGWWSVGDGHFPIIVVAVLALVMISALDDFRGLPVWLRLGVHVLTAGAVCGFLVNIVHGWVLAGVLTLITAWMANAYNFMDGSDGLAGGMAAFGFLFYGLAADDVFAVANYCIVASACAFLIFNFSPAKIFMGDAGSIPLGFLAASFGLLGWMMQSWPWWFPFLVFAPFLADATLTLLKRVASGASMSQAHREHTYQRLIRMGWSHRRLALYAYALMALHISIAAQWIVVIGVALAHLSIIGCVDNKWRKANQAQISQP